MAPAGEVAGISEVAPMGDMTLGVRWGGEGQWGGRGW